jgi:CHAT domain-containing protein
MRFTYTWLFIACISSLHAQDWQTYYKESTSAFTNQKFEEALALSEKALPLSLDDAKTQAFTLQILTASSLELSKPELGLQYVGKEIELFSTIEPAGKNYADALLKKAKLLLMIGKTIEAVSSYSEALPAVEKAYSERTYDYYLALYNQGQGYLMIEKLNEAAENFQVCEKAFQSIEGANEDYLYALYHSGLTWVRLSQKDLAENKLTMFVNLVEKNNLQQWPEYSQAKEMLKGISIVSGDAKSSQELGAMLKRAIEIQNSNPIEARTIYESCEKLIVLNNINDGSALTCLVNYANLLSTSHEIEKAKERIVTAKVFAQKLFPAGAIEHGYVKKAEAYLFLQSGSYEQSLLLYQAALNMFAAAKPEIRFVQTREIAREISTFDINQSLLILEHGFDDKDFESFSTAEQTQFIKLFASICLNGQRPAQMIAVLSRNETKFKSIDCKQAYHLYSGVAFGHQGNFEKSFQSLQAAIAVNPQSPIVSEAYYEMARLEQNAGNVKNAETYYEKSIGMLKTQDEKLVNQVYNSFATFYMGIGNYAAAEKLLNNLLKVQNHPALFYNTIRQNLAAIYQQTGRYVLAKKISTEILKTEAAQFGKVRAEYSVSLQNLALIYQRLNASDSALLLMNEALTLDKKIYGESNLIYATKMANLAALYQDVHNFSKARELYENALSIRKKFLKPDHPDYAFNVFSLAYLFYRTQNIDQALPLFRETSSHYLKQIKEVFPALSEYERTVFYNKVKPVIQGIESFMTEHSAVSESIPGELLNFRLETKALLLNSSIKTRNTILASGNQVLINEFQTWLHIKEQLALLYSLSINDQQSQLKVIDEYETKANVLEKKLSLESEEFSAAFERSTVDWKKIQGVLKPKEAAIEIIRVALPKKDSIIYAAVIIRPTGIPKIVIMPNDVTEGHNFTRYSKNIAFKSQESDSYKVYWKKIDALLEGVSTVFLSPDGAYNKINCLTLYDESAKQYLIDRLNIQLLTNLKELLNVPSAGPPVNKASLIGFPDFKLGTVSTLSEHESSSADAEVFYDVLHGGLTELPGTEKEISQVASILNQKNWSVTVNTREHATEDLIKAIKPDVLHIATHGFFVAYNESGEHTNDGSLSNIKNNAMLRSGILLAGAEKFLLDKLQGKVSEAKREDGVLTALEVMNLALDKTSLVVLSACETAGGDVRNGEGVYGLQRAFLVAGAKNLIMSLWKVDDAATQELMTNFYTFWLNGDTKLVAFRKAQQQLKLKFPYPYFWGAFVLVGNN